MAAPTTAAPAGTVNPGGAYEPFNFVTTTKLLQQADMTAAANAFDCGECHVGGGTMEYLPGSRVALRDIETSADVPGGALAGKVTAFNYFIDQYDVDGDGTKYEAQHIDYRQTGVVEMDCFMCHLDGYEFEDRKAAIRKAKFGATLAIGAGIASSATLPADYGTDGYGTSVVYDASKLVAVKAEDNVTITGYKLAPAVVSNLRATPPTANCSSCHMDVHAVEWKKRADGFTSNTDVHYNIGCMGCHERTDKSVGTIGTSGDFSSASTDRTKLSMCDPAKGGASPFEALAQQLDNIGFKNCVGCHSPGAKTYSTFGAKDPTAAHTSKGLTYHLPFISCEACHIKKTNATTGGLIVDGTGVDHEGRVADHEHNAVLGGTGTTNFSHDRLVFDSNDVGMTDRIAMMWKNDGKLHPVNLHTSFFIRSKNDKDYDFNFDGRKGGADSIMQTHMAEVTGWNADNALFADGVVTESEIDALFAKIQDPLTGRFGSAIAANNLNGQAAPASGIIPRLSFMTVPFKMAHNVVQSYQAWGAGGCSDCHGENKGFYNKAYDMTGGYQMGWNKSTQMSPMTKVNGNSQATYSHPNVKDKFTGRSIAVDPLSSTGMRNDVDRSEFLWENTFMALDKTWVNEIVGGAITFPSATTGSFGGSVLKLQVKASAAAADSTAVTRTFWFSTNPSTPAAVVSTMGAFATNANGFGFTIAVNTAGTGITITAVGDTVFRLDDGADGINFGLPQYIAKPRTPSTYNNYAAVFAAANAGATQATTRAQWVNYLNALGTAVAPQASISVVGGSTAVSPDFAKTVKTAVQVTKDEPVTLVANTPVATGTVTYSWYCSDNGALIAEGATATRTFTQIGTFLCTLTATTTSGVTRENIYVKVVPPYVAPEDQPVRWVAGAGFAGNLTVTGMPTHTKITAAWGDLTATTTDVGAGNHTVAHTFNPVSSRLVDVAGVATYRYPVTVRVYNGTTQVKTISLKVDIAKPVTP